MRQMGCPRTILLLYTCWIQVSFAGVLANPPVKIKYPADREPLRQNHASNERIVYGSDSPQRQGQGQQGQNQGDTPQSVRRILPSSSVDSLARATSPEAGRPAAAAIMPLAAPIETRNLPRSETQPAEVAPSRANGPPQRPRREGDDDFRRVTSPVANGPASPVQITHRVVSPTSPPTRNGFNPSLLGTRSPSPRLRQTDDRPPPSDAFYYGRSPTANNFNRPSSAEIKANQVELGASRKREAAMKVLLSRAVKQGFVVEDEDVELPDSPDEEIVKKLMSAVVRMKQEKSVIQNELVAQIRIASDKASEAERLRRGALQEAAFYRAKIATLESSSMSDLARVEKERILDLERQLASLSSECSIAQRELSQLRETTDSDQALRSASIDRESESTRRADEAEEAHRSVLEELESLRQAHASLESNLRDHSERMITLSSSASQREAERDHLRSQLDEVMAGRDEHVGLIEKAHAAIAVAGTRTTEMENLYQKANGRISDLEAELAEARLEVENRTRDAELSAERLAEIETAYAKSREEADSLRQVTTTRLGELLDTHKGMRADESRAVRGHQEQMRALEEESKSLRKMLREAGQRLEDAEAGVSHHRSKARDLELGHQSLKAELRSFRARHLQAQEELNKARELHGARDSELRERDLAVTEIETRCTVLRNLREYNYCA